MQQIELDSNQIASELTSKIPSRLTLPNEDIIQEYTEAKIMGRGEQYKEYVNDTNDLSEVTESAVDSISKQDFGNVATMAELEREVNKVKNNVYNRSNIKSAVDKLEKKINEQVDVGEKIKVTSLKHLGNLLKRFEQVLTFGGVGVSMILSAAGRYMFGASLMILIFTPLFLGVSLYEGNLQGVKVVAILSLMAGISAASWKGFDQLSKLLDKTYQSRHT